MPIQRVLEVYAHFRSMGQGYEKRGVRASNHAAAVAHCLLHMLLTLALCEDRATASPERSAATRGILTPRRLPKIRALRTQIDYLQEDYQIDYKMRTLQKGTY